VAGTVNGDLHLVSICNGVAHGFVVENSRHEMMIEGVGTRYTGATVLFRRYTGQIQLNGYVHSRAAK
jgi:hypothetical protein